MRNEPNLRLAMWHGHPVRRAQGELAREWKSGAGRGRSDEGQGCFAPVPGGRVPWPKESGGDAQPTKRGLSCGTKPILRLRIADWDRSAAGRLPCGLPPPARAGRLYKQTQLGGPIVQNEPNWAGRPGSRRAKCAKRTQFARRCRVGRGHRGEGRTCKTNPILWGQICETNPICPSSAGNGAGRVGTKRYRRWGQTCETNPIRPEPREGQVLCGERIWNRQLRAERGNPRPYAGHRPV
jgi:hypothetical protein